MDLIDARIVTFVRHGECVLEGADPDKGGPLTARGREQARATGAALAGRRVTRIVASDLPRTGETAVIIAGILDLEVEFDRRVRECVPPLPEDVAALMRIEVLQTASAKSALDSACSDLFAPFTGAPSYTVVVSHGNAIRYMLCRAMDGPETQWVRMLLMNHCGMSSVLVEPGKPPRLGSYNDTRGLCEGLLSR